MRMMKLIKMIKVILSKKSRKWKGVMAGDVSHVAMFEMYQAIHIF